MIDGAPGPTSRIFFSQRLRLHYVDWGNHDAPPLLLLHGGRDHCRNWDWVAGRLRKDWHIIAPDLRGHGDSQWSASANYGMAGYIYDLAQLIHQLKLAPVTIVAHSLGGSIALRYAGIYPDNVKRLVAIEGLGMSPQVLRDRGKKPIDERMRSWIEEQRALAGRLPRRYRDHRGCLQEDAGGEQASVAGTGAASDAAWRQPERGRHLQLEVRQLRAPVAALRHAAGRTSRSCGRASSARRCSIYGKESWASNPEQDGRLQHFKKTKAQVVSFERAGHWVHHDRLDGVHAGRAAVPGRATGAGDQLGGSMADPSVPRRTAVAAGDSGSTPSCSTSCWCCPSASW